MIRGGTEECISNNLEINFANDHSCARVGTFGKGKRNPYRRTDSQDSDEQTKSEASATSKDPASSLTQKQENTESGKTSNVSQRNSKMYKCASSDDILGARGSSWASSPSTNQEENLYEPLNKEMSGK